MSHGRVREMMRDLLEGIGLNPNDHGLHSFRAGAATHAANQPNVTDRQWVSMVVGLMVLLLILVMSWILLNRPWLLLWL